MCSKVQALVQRETLSAKSSLICLFCVCKKNRASPNFAQSELARLPNFLYLRESSQDIPSFLRTSISSKIISFALSTLSSLRALFSFALSSGRHSRYRRTRRIGCGRPGTYLCWELPCLPGIQRPSAGLCFFPDFKGMQRTAGTSSLFQNRTALIRDGIGMRQTGRCRNCKQN